jgi:MFS family permease
MLNPVAMAIVATTFPDRIERARAIGVFGSMSGLALALGPILGGALVDGFGWRSVSTRCWSCACSAACRSARRS